MGRKAVIVSREAFLTALGLPEGCEPRDICARFGSQGKELALMVEHPSIPGGAPSEEVTAEELARRVRLAADEVTAHRTGGVANERLTIRRGPPGPGGAPGSYVVRREPRGAGALSAIEQSFHFAHARPDLGGITDGLTNECLLAIVADRLERFQTGPFACQSNARALVAIQLALSTLAERTDERKARGVEGSHKP